MRIAAAGALVIFAVTLNSQTYERDLNARVKLLVKQNGKGTDKALRARLIAMAKRDQSVRTPAYTGAAAPEELVRAQQRVDDELMVELKQLVEEHGWPTIRLAGLRASEDAALVLTHSRDHDWQTKLVPVLQELADAGKILGSGIAGIVDKILVSEHKPQRFGTQFNFAGGVLEMLPVEDEANLEQRRAKYLLPLMSEYRKMLARLYLLP